MIHKRAKILDISCKKMGCLTPDGTLRKKDSKNLAAYNTCLSTTEACFRNNYSAMGDGVRVGDYRWKESITIRFSGGDTPPLKPVIS
jgi:hypothetical protein